MSVDTLDVDNSLETIENEDISGSKNCLSEAEKEVYAEENFSLIYFVVNKFRNTKVDPDELESVGAIGFAKALNSFDPSQQVKFTTYVVRCIQNEILNLLCKERNVTSRNISIETILSVGRYGKELRIGDLLCNEECGRDKWDYRIELGLDIEKLSVLFQDLDKMERFIIESRFGLGTRFVKTQREISKEIGISQGQVSKIEKKVLDMMKKELICRFEITGEEFKSKIENTSTLLEASYYVNKYIIKFGGNYRGWRYVNGCFSNS